MPGCPLRARIHPTDDRYVTACQLPDGHPGFCKNIDGEAITTIEIPVELRAQVTAANFPPFYPKFWSF